jgi:RNA polymerase sigma-70 factor (ECF subfamily)
MEQAITMTADTRQQFEALLDRHRRIVFKVAGTYSRDPEDRADIAQEIALQLWRAFPGYDRERPFTTWMYRIALNVGISFLRGNARRVKGSVTFDERVHDFADDSAADPEAAERARMLHRCISRFDALDRALLLLYLEERSYREISDILGISETNVGTKIARLKERIRNHLDRGAT